MKTKNTLETIYTYIYIYFKGNIITSLFKKLKTQKSPYVLV
jgi:hypothetical protein